ncbi:IGR protein motif-domain-containing protein [Abortiporus biennis]|nr:IGR protein motif-domain-containing protein [Abortiporus biennis]
MSSLLGLRIFSSIPQQCRTLVNRAALKTAPPKRGGITSPELFLKAIGRSADTKVTAESWTDLWKLNGHALKKSGVPVKDRRYILWAMEKFRQQEDPAEFAHERKPKKKIRGRGPAVQNGKRIRSRRHR